MKRTIITSIISIILIILFIVSIVLWGIYGNKSDDKIWHLTFYEIVILVITLFLGIIVTYYLPERNTRKRLFDNTYIEKVKSLSAFLENTCKCHLLNDYMKKDFNLYVITDSKTVNNKISLLENHAQNEEIKKELAVIRNQFFEYRTLTTNCIDSLKRDDQLRILALVKIELIMSSLSNIEFIIINKKS